MALTLSILSRRGYVCSTGTLLLLLCVICLACITSFSDAASTEDSQITCSYCQERGYAYMCNVTMSSGICFTYSGEMTCSKEKGCACCRSVSAAGCTFCSMEAEWDAYDDSDDDI
ncbi:hypothetical protein JKF63_00276 [Porcisia hertigi]|uniref:Uncharacterized protein n=1 Tax=Porcisia hertigi TaxID=2761500 RepID=A0A836HPP6_9TRYP|nr:hypothetical protein JKF63_00276 [Porcisia hertigi]